MTFVQWTWFLRFFCRGFVLDPDGSGWKNIKEWETQFWINRIPHDKYELYHAVIDTTFTLVNWNYFAEPNNCNVYRCIRIAGNFTCIHLPWYNNFLENNFEVHLNLSDESINRLAKVYYIAGTTTGFDNGYDGKIFSSQNNDFTIYTAHDSEENDSDMKLSVQSIPEMSHVVPVGINAFEGTEFTISATTLNRPDGYNVYLEDRDNNTFTLLNETSDFTTTVSSNLNGTGRYYLHTTSASLSTGNVLGNNPVSIFTTSRENVRIVGVQSGTANVQLYNIAGKLVLNTSFEGTGSNDIILPILSSGIYIVQVKNESGTINKKVVIE